MGIAKAFSKTDPNLYTKSKTDLGLGKDVRIIDTLLYLPNSPGLDDEGEMYKFAGCQTVVEEIYDGFIPTPERQAWVYLRIDQTEFVWDVRWLELI